MNENLKKEKVTIVLLFIYCLVLVWIILFKMSFSINDLDKIRSINLIPFYYKNEVSFHLTEVIENVLIFIPFGIYLKMLDKSNKKAIMLGLLFSLILEIMQYILSIGTTDITDIITNTSGSIIGVYMYYILNKIFKNKEKINKLLKLLAIIGTILFMLLFLLVIVSNR